MNSAKRGALLSRGASRTLPFTPSVSPHDLFTEEATGSDNELFSGEGQSEWFAENSGYT